MRDQVIQETPEPLGIGDEHESCRRCRNCFPTSPLANCLWMCAVTRRTVPPAALCENFVLITLADIEAYHTRRRESAGLAQVVTPSLDPFPGQLTPAEEWLDQKHILQEEIAALKVERENNKLAMESAQLFIEDLKARIAVLEGDDT